MLKTVEEERMIIHVQKLLVNSLIPNLHLTEGAIAPRTDAPINATAAPQANEAINAIHRPI